MPTKEGEGFMELKIRRSTLALSLGFILILPACRRQTDYQQPLPDQSSTTLTTPAPRPSDPSPGSGMNAEEVGQETPNAAGAPDRPPPDPPGVGHDDPLGLGSPLPDPAGANQITGKGKPGLIHATRPLPQTGNDGAKAGYNQPGVEAVPQMANPSNALQGESVHCPSEDPAYAVSVDSGKSAESMRSLDCPPGSPNSLRNRIGKPGNP